MMMVTPVCFDLKHHLLGDDAVRVLVLGVENVRQ